MKLSSVYKVLFLSFLWIVARVLSWILSPFTIEARLVCPKCKKGFLKEQALDYPVTQPSREKHVYREFYLTCRCGYSEKMEGKPELVI